MKKLVCIGGGEIPRYKNGILLPYETREIDEEIVRISNKKNPKLLFISIASSHPDEYFDGIKKVYTNLGCSVNHLSINQTYKELEKEILGTDIIYIGGGDTKFLLNELKATGIDKLLVKAYESGIVCSGLSAGSYCWFKYNYDLLEGMGVINAINCVHYEQKDENSKNKFYKVINDKNMIGYAMDNCVALEFIDDEINIIKSDKTKNAYKVIVENEKVKEIII